MSQDIALFCKLHPASAEKKERVSSLLQHLLPYYHSPNAKCTTWCYFTPATRQGAPDLMVANDNKAFVIAGMELYTDKDAFSVQTADQTYKDYHALVKKENLYEKDEELVAWKPRGGYLSRAATAPPFGKGVVVMTAKFVCKDGEAAGKVVKRLATYAAWVKENEPDVLSYSVMSRNKDPKEVLMFERYKTLGAIKAHGSSKEFKAMFKDIRGYLGGTTTMNEWEEIDGTFVGNVIGGQPSSKL